MKSTDLPDILGNRGFTREYSNVYIYTENDTYYGEIIIQPEVSIIYIKQRSGGFDSKINSVLSELLPSEYSRYGAIIFLLQVTEHLLLREEK